jgi:hypothetical protein
MHVPSQELVVWRMEIDSSKVICGTAPCVRGVCLCDMHKVDVLTNQLLR